MADSGSDPAKEASAPGGDGGPKPPRVPMVRSTSPNGRAEAADLSNTLKQLVVESMSSAIAELKEELTREISRSFNDAHRPADEALKEREDHHPNPSHAKIVISDGKNLRPP